jgi:phenylpyruvate tautomerase PptA (4-oxalocrotonate tautomerase family)
MPIIDIDIVGGATGLLDVAAAPIAHRIGAALGAVDGSVWVRLSSLPSTHYAENGPTPDPPPVFVRVLARIDDARSVALTAQQIAAVVAAVVERPRERVHVIFEADAGGRVFFGGQTGDA